MISCETSRRRSAAAVALVAGGALLAIGGCSDATGPGLFEHQLASARWDEAGPDDYSFVFDQLCYCPYTGPYRVAVEGDGVVEVTPLPGSMTIGPVEPEYFPTIDDLLERLRDAAERDPVKFEVTYDEDLGYPTSADVDISEQIVDEEYSFEVRELEAR